MIITINGLPGSGKGTIGELLSDKLSSEFMSMGSIRRNFAKEHGMTLEQLNKQAETNPESDKLVDNYLVELGKTRANLVIDGRLAFYFIPQSFKLFFTVSEAEGARRIHQANRSEEKYSTIEKTIESLKERQASDVLRYGQLYGVNPYDTKVNKYDLILDTTEARPQKIANMLVKIVEKLAK